MGEITPYLSIRMKIIIGIILLGLIGFITVRNLNAQVHVSNKSYDVMLSSLLSHTVNEVGVNDIVTESYIMLDARERNEYEVSHIPGAIWVGYEDFDPGRLDELDKDAPLVVYCSVGYRSEKIAEALTEKGFSNVSNLYGGIFEWVNAGHQVVDMQDAETSKVHAYSKSWGVWLKKGKKVYD